MFCPYSAVCVQLQKKNVKAIACLTSNIYVNILQFR